MSRCDAVVDGAAAVLWFLIIVQLFVLRRFTCVEYSERQEFVCMYTNLHSMFAKALVSP